MGKVAPLHVTIGPLSPSDAFRTVAKDESEAGGGAYIELPEASMRLSRSSFVFGHVSGEWAVLDSPSFVAVNGELAAAELAGEVDEEGGERVVECEWSTGLMDDVDGLFIRTLKSTGACVPNILPPKSSSNEPEWLDWLISD